MYEHNVHLIMNYELYIITSIKSTRQMLCIGGETKLAEGTDGMQLCVVECRVQ